MKYKDCNSTTQSRVSRTLKKKAFENIAGKVENAGNQHFLLFPQCISSAEITILTTFNCCVQMHLIWSNPNLFVC